MTENILRGSWAAGAQSDAPPSFMVDGNRAVPMDVNRLDLVIEANVAQARAIGSGRLSFTVAESGRPLLDLVPNATALKLDGESLPPERLREVEPPEESTRLRMLDEECAAGETHELEIEYVLSDMTAQFAGNGVQLGLFMTDLRQRGYLERHAPANLLFDQMPMRMEVRLTGSSNTHRLFSNGQITDGGSGTWQVTMPDYFTCSSCFLHLTDRLFAIRDGSYIGLEREIPVTVYGEGDAQVAQKLDQAIAVLDELERTYGAYTHEALLIYWTGNGGGGMEYAGATMTGSGALAHEITHSWFARGVMPANGSAGWIDEAIASWRDQGYPTAAAAPLRRPVNLAGFSPYHRHTPTEAYDEGALLLSELDRLFQPAGLRPILAKLYQAKRLQLITTPFFQSFLEQQSGMSLATIFDRYVYGKDDGADAHVHETADALTDELHAASIAALRHAPRAYTPAELKALL